MADIFDPTGEKIAAIPLSERQLQLLDVGTTIVVQYHTPQLLRGILGEQTGSFALHKMSERIIATDPHAVKICAEMLQGVEFTRKKPDA
jgi:hypothetical protein